MTLNKGIVFFLFYFILLFIILLLCNHNIYSIYECLLDGFCAISQPPLLLHPCLCLSRDKRSHFSKLTYSNDSQPEYKATVFGLKLNLAA